MWWLCYCLGHQSSVLDPVHPASNWGEKCEGFHRRFGEPGPEVAHIVSMLLASRTQTYPHLIAGEVGEYSWLCDWKAKEMGFDNSSISVTYDLLWSSLPEGCPKNVLNNNSIIWVSCWAFYCNCLKKKKKKYDVVDFLYWFPILSMFRMCF